MLSLLLFCGNCNSTQTFSYPTLRLKIFFAQQNSGKLLRFEGLPLIIAMIGTSDQASWMAEAYYIVLLLHVYLGK